MNIIDIIKEVIMPGIITIGATLLFSIINANFDGKDENEKKKLIIENFHLNSVSVFIGYTALSFNRVFILGVIVCGLFYELEHRMLINVFISDKNVKTFNLIALLLSVVIHLACICTLIDTGKAG